MSGIAVACSTNRDPPPSRSIFARTRKNCSAGISFQALDMASPCSLARFSRRRATSKFFMPTTIPQPGQSDILLPFEKLKNLSSQGAFRFATGKDATPKQLAAFLYKIDFLVARKDLATEIHRKYFEQSRYLSSEFADFGYDWEIHPAYRWALQPDNILRLYEEIDLTPDTA